MNAYVSCLPLLEIVKRFFQSKKARRFHDQKELAEAIKILDDQVMACERCIENSEKRIEAFNQEARKAMREGKKRHAKRAICKRVMETRTQGNYEKHLDKMEALKRAMLAHDLALTQADAFNMVLRKARLTDRDITEYEKTMNSVEDTSMIMEQFNSVVGEFAAVSAISSNIDDEEIEKELNDLLADNQEEVYSNNAGTKTAVQKQQPEPNRSAELSRFTEPRSEKQYKELPGNSNQKEDASERDALLIPV
jgi:hypothetical protein